MAQASGSPRIGHRDWNGELCAEDQDEEQANLESTETLKLTKLKGMGN
ncbi:MAG: hypothetical protein VX484_04495 [Chloroflexota bacterium]|nr:hypothetical protein [Chloroflexota bacterium]